jgi:hypothetical protein
MFLAPFKIINDSIYPKDPNATQYTEVIESRYKFPYNAPVNMNVYGSVTQNVVRAANDLYTPGDTSVRYHLLDTPPAVNTNVLNYSGGRTELLKIPLQMNDPNMTEQLRSQDVLINSYNRIKYSTGNC